jgi:hypothetical protein
MLICGFVHRRFGKPEDSGSFGALGKPRLLRAKISRLEIV